jgi:tetratricopeptide (TPR) repeat protein
VRFAFDVDDKYSINPEIRLLATGLVQQSLTVTAEMRKRIAQLSAEKHLDYSKQEFELLVVFEQYLASEQFVDAEDFIKERLKERPNSVLLNLHYAKYLKEVKREVPEAISRLEFVRQKSGNDPHVLRLLMMYYIALDAPNFEQAYVYAKDLERAQINDDEIRMDLAHFYTEWATTLKLKVELDPLKEMKRQQKYKELSEQAIGVLRTVSDKNTHTWQYLLAQCQFNKWEYDTAKQSIDRAIALLPATSYLSQSYERLRGEIIKKWQYYKKRA